VSAGDFVLAVNGLPLPATTNIYEAFEMTAQKLVTLTVSDSPVLGASAAQRDVDVVTLSGAAEQQIRQWSWAEVKTRRCFAPFCTQNDHVTAFLSHLYIKTMILPRQARDKHRENSQKRCIFLQERAVRTRPSLSEPPLSYCKTTSIYRDRLGTNIGKDETKQKPFSFIGDRGRNLRRATRLHLHAEYWYGNANLTRYLY
jgi:hypothetical protein